jgi:serine O-acetyltransferase
VQPSHHQHPPASMAEARRSHPPFLRAVLADARTTARYGGEQQEFRGQVHALLHALRLMWVSDAFAAQVLYRAKATLQRRRVPILPLLAHHAAIVLGQVSIADSVVMRPGVAITHGQVVIGGLMEIRGGTLVAPFVSIGLRAGDMRGPTIGSRVRIGTGARLLGPIEVGTGAQIGANAVVLDDVPAGATVAGAPARPVGAPTRIGP